LEKRPHNNFNFPRRSTGVQTTIRWRVYICRHCHRNFSLNLILIFLTLQNKDVLGVESTSFSLQKGKRKEGKHLCTTRFVDVAFLMCSFVLDVFCLKSLRSCNQLFLRLFSSSNGYAVLRGLQLSIRVVFALGEDVFDSSLYWNVIRFARLAVSLIWLHNHFCFLNRGLQK